MRKNNYFYNCLFILLIVSIGCYNELKNNPYGPFFNPYFGNAEYLLNGEQFNCFPYSDTSYFANSTIDLNLLYYNEFNRLESTLIIANIPSKPGQYDIVSGDVITGQVSSQLLIFQGDPDLTASVYHYDSTLMVSYIEIVEYDSVSMEIKGNFTIQLKRVKLYSDEPLYPEIIEIDGNFYTKVGYDK